MGYLKIQNLYKNQDILSFKECYALEKIHGTSAHISWKNKDFVNNYLTFFSGGVKHEAFTNLFNDAEIREKFIELGIEEVTIYGEAYGGSCQKMSDVYGKELKFVAFDVKIADCWLDVPSAAQFVGMFGIEFVYYVRCSTDLEVLDEQRDRDSAQSFRNGLGIHGDFKKGEGVVLRPIIEVVKNNGNRIIAKHKRADFSETKTPREVNPEKLIVLAKVKEICREWVTENRLGNILSHLPYDDIEGGLLLEVSHIPVLINLMIDDVIKEGEGEIVDTPDLRRAIARETALLVKRRVGIE